MKTIPATLAAAILLLTASAADAAKFQGRADDGTKVALKTNGKCRPTLVKFGHYKADCDSGYTAVSDPISGFEPPFTEASRTHVLDQGRQEAMVELDDVSGQVHVVATYKFEAHFTDGQWVGDYRSRGNYEQNSERITRCAARFSFALSPK